MRTPLAEERPVDGKAPFGARDETILVSRHEAARLLGVGATTIDTMIRTKALRSVRISRRRLVVRASISEYVSRAENTA